MSSWNCVQIGFTVKAEEKRFAEQFLEIIGARDSIATFSNEIGPLSHEFKPEIAAVLNTSYHYFYPHLKETLDKQCLVYTNQFQDAEQVKKVSIKPIPLVDGYIALVKSIFASPFFYLAYEVGNSSVDDYYRYEMIYNPGTGKKKELYCYYSYGAGINVDTENPKEDNTVMKESAVKDKLVNSNIIKTLISHSKDRGYNELAERLSALI